MFQLVQENNALKLKYYELLNEYNKLKNESERMNNKNTSEIQHLNKINVFLKNKTVDLNKTIVEKNKHLFSLISKR